MAGPKKTTKHQKTAEIVGVRIIGGRFRGRNLAYSGDLRTRPMKDRVREALFNLLGPAVKGKIAIDLFAGTGALALEALSRGATRAIAIELHRPTARLIAQNAAAIGVKVRFDQRIHSDSNDESPRVGGGENVQQHLAERDEYVQVVTANSFLWAKGLSDLVDAPWVVFCSPPYDFYVQRQADMLEMLKSLTSAAPAASLFAVEADDRFDYGLLPDPDAWDVRRYPPAVLGIWEKPAGPLNSETQE